MKIFFIPNWNGHLKIPNYDDNSVLKIYKQLKYKNKEIIEGKKNEISKTQNLIYKKSLDEKDFILSIAGDHSNSYALIKSFSKKNKDFSLVIFDAHPDCEASTGVVSHEDYLRFLVEKKIVSPKNIYLFGIRNFSRLEFDFLEKYKINFFTITDILKNKKKVENILKKIKENIYLSVDIDVLDPTCAPATYYSENCGLYIEELIEFIKILKPKIKSCDICEFYGKFEDKKKTTEKNILKIIDIFIKL